MKEVRDRDTRLLRGRKERGKEKEDAGNDR